MADRVTVIGWDGSPLSAAARAALGAATMVAGAPHHLRILKLPPSVEQILLGSVQLAARRIAEHRGAAVVLVDGDPGFFGALRELRRAEFGFEVEVIPAVSAVSGAFARAGMAWDDAKVVVAHSRALRRAVNVCRAHPKVAVLTAPGAGPVELALLLGDVPRTFVICEALGTEREETTVLTSDKVADHSWRDPNVVLVVGGSGTSDSGSWIAGHTADYPGPVRGWALPDEIYASSGDVANEKRSAASRAMAVAMLGPRTGDLLWDIGAGIGALAVEAARFGAAVIAVERDPDACGLLTANARRFGVQVQVVCGVAPAVLEDLPEPDIIRIGCGGMPVVAACAARRPERIVMTAADRAQADSAGRLLGSYGYAVDSELLRSMRFDATGGEFPETAAFILCARRS